MRSGKQNAAVEMRWAELLEQNMPQELQRDILDQKAACSSIIASKDGLISDFQTQLKGKDEEYVKSLKQQADDVTALLARMRGEFKELQDEYEAELDAIEESFLLEREQKLSANKAAIDALFDQRREMELGFMEAKQQRQEAYQAEIEALLTRDGEEYNKLKVKLETDIQTLEQQLEEMRATYQLNTEKLEYNYRYCGLLVMVLLAYLSILLEYAHNNLCLDCCILRTRVLSYRGSRSCDSSMRCVMSRVYLVHHAWLADALLTHRPPCHVYDYFNRVLTERDMENSATLAHQKRKLTKLKDALSALVQRYQETGNSTEFNTCCCCEYLSAILCWFFGVMCRSDRPDSHAQILAQWSRSSK